MRTRLVLAIFIAGLCPLLVEGESFSFTEAGGIFSASSELEKPANPMDRGRYSPGNLLDRDPSTAWVEGEKGPGIGSFVLLGAGNSLKRYIVIYNGYEQSERLFKKNNRVQKLAVTVYAGFTREAQQNQFGFTADAEAFPETVEITLEDKMGPQVFPFPFDTGKVKAFKRLLETKYHADDEKKVREFYFFKFKILSVYRGSTWNDTCIAEIGFGNRKMGEFVPLNENISGVYEDENSDAIFVKTSGGHSVLLVSARSVSAQLGYTGSGEFLTLNLMDVDAKKHWALIAYEHGFTAGGSIEETYHLWSLKLLQEVPPTLEAAYGLTPDAGLSFTVKNGRSCLETDSGNSILLEDLELDMDRSF